MLLKICLLLTLGILCSSQRRVPERLIGNPCISKLTCGDCIRAHPECAWCSQEDFDGSSRCDYTRNLIGLCADEHIVIPAQGITKLKNEELGSKRVEENEFIQIKPQEINLKLIPNSPFPLLVDFKQVEDYPVDVYILMDLSNSMKDYKDKLANLGNLLSEEMQKITQNFRIGFGSFVDKVPEKLKEPCTDFVAPYGFRNHMSLTSATSTFAQLVRDATEPGNLDSPERGLDAIMQAIVCQWHIGWREGSRKILIFASDRGLRYAGDGKLDGILRPNDGYCHLDYNGYYTESENQDNPSLSLINHKIQENKVNIIFAVTADQVPVYERLSKLLVGSSAGKLENDSSDIVDLVRNQYDQIRSSVELKDNARSNIEVTYHSNCLGDKKETTNICRGLKMGTNVTFEVGIEVTSCPKDSSKWDQTFQIYPVGVRGALNVHLEMICECECEKPWNEEKNSDKCTFGNGIYECGVCSCYNNRYGRKCECDAELSYQTDSGCYPGNDRMPCSGRGQCTCGACECFKRTNPEEKVYGQFCECDNYSCARSDGKICSGPDHGVCECGYCRCKEGWTGYDCSSCSNSLGNCISPKNGEICSGHGDCECNECKCYDLGEFRYSGSYCENCPTCPLRCDAFRDCVECQIFPDDNDVPAENCTACSFIPVVVDKIEIKDDIEKYCVFRDDKDCQFTFKYKLDADDQPIVHAQRTKDCPEPVSILGGIRGLFRRKKARPFP